MNRIGILKEILIENYGMKISVIADKIEKTGYRIEKGNIITKEQIKKYIKDLKIKEFSIEKNENIINNTQIIKDDVHCSLEIKNPNNEELIKDKNIFDDNLNIKILTPYIKEEKREKISRRTKEALAALKARGVQLGRPEGHSRTNQEEINKSLGEQCNERYMNRISVLKGILVECYGMKIAMIADKVEKAGYRTEKGNIITKEQIKKYIKDLKIEEIANSIRDRLMDKTK